MTFLVWLVVAVVLAVLEIFTVGFFLIFFAVGALLTAVATLWLPPPYDTVLWQMIVFLVSSSGLLLLARPLVRGYFKIGEKPTKASNSAALLGERVLVLETVDRYRGRVRLLNTGEVWSAYLVAGEDSALTEGQEGTVQALDGAKLAVAPLAQSA